MLWALIFSESSMYIGQLVFSQVTDHLPMHTFRRCVQRYQGERYVKRFRCLDQYLSMAFAQHALRCQRTTRLAYLSRLCPSLDPNRTTSVHRGRPGPRTRQHRLRTRCVNHRSLSFRIPLSIVPIHKICSQTSYLAGSAWQHPNLYTYLRWQTARCQCTRHSSARSRCLLHHGSGVRARPGEPF
jgi:hypothetical protein